MDRTLSLPYELLPVLCRDLEGKDLVTAALLCKAFLEPALDKLWHHVKSFEPLLACLPDGLLLPLVNQGARTIELTGPIRAADLQRYQSQYAHRIRVFEVGQGQSMLSFEALQVLQFATEFQNGALAPRATALVWHSNVMIGAPHTFSYLPLFLGPHISRISFDFSRVIPLHVIGVEWAFSHTECLKQLTLRKTIHVMDGGFLDSFIPILPWGSLQILDISPVSVASVPILMTSPHLVKLSMVIIEGEPQDRINMGRIKIPSRPESSSLEVLNISTDEFELLETALQLLPSNIRLLSLECSFGVDTSTGEINRLFNLIQKKCNPDTLSELYLQGVNRNMADGGDPLDDDMDDFANVSPLLTFSNLEALTILLPTARIDLIPEHADLIPTVWSRIGRLILNTTMNDSWTLSPRIDHTHLTNILRGCPRLRVLGVRFNATLIKDEPSNSLGPMKEREWVTSTLEELQVGDSPVLSPSRVAAFLRVHCPAIKKLEHAEYSNPGQGSLILYDKRWKDVAGKLNL